MEIFKSDWFSKWGIVTISVGLILSIVSYQIALEMKHETHIIQFMRAIDNQLTAFQEEIDTDLEVLFSIEGFYAASKHIDHEEFGKFVKRSLERHESIQTLGWIPRIKHKNRITFEQSAQAELGIFEITELQNSQIVRADDRDEYFPVHYVFPSDGNEKALGYDLASDPKHLTTLVKARDSGKALMTTRIGLVQEKNNKYVFLVFLPIYKGDYQTIFERQANLQGFVLAIYHIKKIAENSLMQVNQAGVDLDLHIYDVTDKKLLLYPLLNQENHDKQERLAKNFEMFHKSTIDIMGGKWELELMPTKNYFINHHQIWILFFIPVIVLLFTCMAFIIIKQRTSELREDREELRKLSLAVKHSPNLTIITNLNGNIQYVNPAFETVTGYTQVEVLGKNPRILRSGQTTKEKYDELWSTIRAGKVWRGEMQNKRKDGSFYWALMNISPVLDARGTSTHFVSIQDDITDRKITESCLEEARNEAERANESKSEFLANMSHEIRTPMNAVIGMSQLVLETELNDYQQKHLTTVNKSARGLLRILNDILDFSKIESGKMDIHPEAFYLKKTIEAALSPFMMLTQSKGLILKLKLSKNLPACFMGDSDRLTQVIQNLVSNSIKFTEKGSIIISIKPTKTGLCFSITDTGIGIPQDRQNAIFESFTQADGGTTRKYGGTGLGTTISKKIVELMGGRIWLESEEGKGSIFSFEIPLVKTECVAEESQQSIAVLKPLKILLAEDQKANWELVMIRLKEREHQVTLAQNGKEAVNTWKENQELSPFDLILMDLQMPIVNGLEATRAIRSKEENDPIPIIALTASIMTEDMKECHEAGMNGYISKPIDFDVLWEEIGKVIPSAVLKKIEFVPKSSLTENSLGDLAGVNVQAGLKRWGEAAEVYRKSLLGFARDHAKDVQRIRAELKNNNIEGVKRITHSLKGVGSNLAITDVTKVVILLDKALHNNQLDKVETLLIRLDEACSIAIKSILTLEDSIQPDVESEEVDLTVVKPFLQELAKFIQDEDLIEAEQILAILLKSLPQIKEVANQLDNYEFDEALVALNEIANQIGAQL